MTQMWNALGEVFRAHKWIPGTLAMSGVVATFVLAGKVPALVFLVILLASILVGTLLLLGQQSPDLAPEEPQIGTTGVGVEISTPQSEELGLEGVRDTEPDLTSESQSGVLDSDPDMAAFLQAVDAATAGDAITVRTILDPVIEGSKDDEQRNRRTASKNALLVQAGETNKLHDLEASVERAEKPRADILRWYAFALDLTASRSEAIQTLLAEAGSLDADEAAEARLFAVQMMLKDDRLAEALELCSRIGGSPSLPGKVRARAYDFMAKALKPRGVLRALRAYEEALRLDPAANRFDLAYLYSESAMHVMAKHHYQTMVRVNQGGHAARNNLGVAYSQLQMPGLASEAYRVAGERGSARAFGNMASQAIHGGDHEAAREYIGQGLELDKEDDVILNVRERLRSAKASERERDEATDRCAAELRGAILEVPLSASEIPLSGTTWRLEGSDSILGLHSVTENVFVASANASADDSMTLTLTRRGLDYTCEAKLSKYGNSLNGHAFLIESGSLIVLLGEDYKEGRPGVLRFRPVDVDLEEVPQSETA
jgi:tetratricopeptide (TPR) repeat protein